jgi:tRNA (guanine-N(7)-)-methyltransferase
MTRIYSAELLSLFDPRYLEFQSRDVERFEQARASVDWSRPIAAIEIGSNRGEFLEGLARAYPEQLVVGFEWRAKYCELARERLERRGVKNAVLLQGDAKIGFPLCIPPTSVGEVHVTFPDPWWRAKHENRRVLEPLFMRVIARRLVDGGRLYLKSDVFDYLYRVRTFGEVSGAFRPLPSHLWPSETNWSLTTRETKCRNGAIPYGRMYLQKHPAFDPTMPLVPERSEHFSVDENIDPIALIRGAPLVDRQQRTLHGRRRK